jgi:hypothetical protein
MKRSIAALTWMNYRYQVGWEQRGKDRYPLTVDR